MLEVLQFVITLESKSTFIYIERVNNKTIDKNGCYNVYIKTENG